MASTRRPPYSPRRSEEVARLASPFRLKNHVRATARASPLAAAKEEGGEKMLKFNNIFKMLVQYFQ